MTTTLLDRTEAAEYFFTYIDQRTRLEGWEVSLRLKAVARDIEEAGRW